MKYSQKLRDARSLTQGMFRNGNSRHARSLQEQWLAEWSRQHGHYRLHLYILFPRPCEISIPLV